MAPSSATPGHFRRLGLDLVPATGLLPAVVPGAFGAWLMLLREHGTMALEDILAPAIHYAERGYPLLPRIAGAMASVRELFCTEWPSSAAIYCPDSGPPASGEWFANPVLAGTYRRILAEAASAGGGRERRLEAARRAWYEGFVAEAVDDFYRYEKLRDTSGERHGGLLSGADMAAWHPTREAPALLDYAGCTIAKCGLWSQGPVMLQQLALLESMGIADTAGDEVAFVHLTTEAAKLAFADREAWYGDTDDQSDRLAALLDPLRTVGRRALVGEEASSELRPGALGGLAPGMPRHRVADPDAPDVTAMLGASEPTVADGEPVTDRQGAMRGDTCHIDVADRWGNLVAATPSGGWFQSSPVVSGLGFSISTRAQMFWLEEGLASTLVARQATAHDAYPVHGAAGGYPVARVGHARRRPAGSVVAVVSLAPPPPRARSAGGDRGAIVPQRALAELVLAARGATESARAGRASRSGNGGRATSTRARCAGGRAVVGGAVVGVREAGGHRSASALRGGQPARDAGLRGGTLSQASLVRFGRRRYVSRTRCRPRSPCGLSERCAVTGRTRGRLP